MCLQEIKLIRYISISIFTNGNGLKSSDNQVWAKLKSLLFNSDVFCMLTYTCVFLDNA